MDIEELFQELEETIEELEKEEQNGEIEECITMWDSDLLETFQVYISDMIHSGTMPMWAKAFHQISLWQFQKYYDGVVRYYYENFYGNTDYKITMEVAQYLKQNGYAELYKYYVAPAVEGYGFNEYPEEMYPVLEKTEQWIETEDGERAIWNFYVDILTKNKAALIALQKEKQK